MFVFKTVLSHPQPEPSLLQQPQSLKQPRPNLKSLKNYFPRANLTYDPSGGAVKFSAVVIINIQLT